MPAPSPPRLWTIPPSAPFLESLADGIAEGRLVPDGYPPHHCVILLPTRRSCRGLADLMAAQAGDEAVLLPRIRPIADVDEAELALGAAEQMGAAEDILELPPAIALLRRQILLTELVLQWGRTVARTLLVPGRNEPVAIPVRPGDAALLARDLARLMDDFETEGRPFSALHGLVPDDHADYWRLTLEFLRIATEKWPYILKEERSVDPAKRRDALLRAEGARLRRNPPDHPIIAAGSTGTIPATAELLSVIARLPAGAVVLPGLNLEMDAASWDALDAPAAPHPAHPQYGLKLLLQRMGVAREAVESLRPPVLPERERLVAEALRPPATTEAWADLAARISQEARGKALSGLAVVEATGEREEATAIALALREAAETPDRTAALITPDRSLARRVSAELLRWGLVLDDSAGVPLAETPPGVLLRLIAETAAARLAPASLVALLQHPLASFGLMPGDARRAARHLELLALRGPRPSPGVDGLLRLTERAVDRGKGEWLHPAVARLGREDRAQARALAERIAEAFRPFEALAGGREIPLGDLVARHDEALQRIACKEDGSCAAFEGVAGEALQTFLDGLAETADIGLPAALQDYPALLGVLASGSMVRAPGVGHPRLSILGPLEARLLSADLVVLGSLNEGSWPADTRTDPFLNRPMRAVVGLEAPERFIGLAAHDVAQQLAAPQVVLTRAVRTGGEPTVASRWLQRLQAVAGDEAWRTLAGRGGRYLDWARAIDLAEDREVVGEPLPRPAVADRPARLSVTEIETLIRDPYSVYARRVLRLEPLDELDAAPDAATRGSLIHDAMREFDAVLAKGDADDPVARLIAIGKTLFEEIEAFPELHAIWWPRFCRVARWFAPLDAAERAILADRRTELAGLLKLDIAGQPFHLAGRADRIDVTADGGLRIVDYKTGGVPSVAQVESGLSPQLPLEAAMVQAGAFDGIPPGQPITGLTYITLKGGNPPGEICDIMPRQHTLDGLAATTLSNLIGLLTRFAEPGTPYRAKTHVQQLSYATAYDHLSRYPEWSVAKENGD